ncbi:ParA family protein [Vulcanisaeta distributa]|uniref:ParA family protein n=1 Tax=Vulcanisaeta distributa TaxID=164451 RepID=UPI0006CF9812|nr:ParA family protein [Vulcanisaeta distributa]
MTVITVTSGNVGGVGGKTTITLALMMNTKNVAYIDLSPDNRSLSLLLGLNPPRIDVIDSVRGGKYMMYVRDGNIVIPIRHREYLELRQLGEIAPTEVQRMLRALEKTLVNKYGVENLVIDTMSTVNLGLTMGAIEAADKLLIPLVREREELIRRTVPRVGTKHIIYALNMVKENLRIDGVAAVIPYVEGANNQLEVAERIRSYARNLMKVVLE